MNEYEIELTKGFIKIASPWRQDEYQYIKWITYLNRLCNHHKKPRLNLVIHKKVIIPNYSPSIKTIFLTKYSIIGLLHEFGHHLDKIEPQCKKYSEHIFLTANPKAKNYLVKDERGYLIKKQEAGGAKK